MFNVFEIRWVYHNIPTKAIKGFATGINWSHQACQRTGKVRGGKQSTWELGSRFWCGLGCFQLGFRCWKFQTSDASLAVSTIIHSGTQLLANGYGNGQEACPQTDPDGSLAPLPGFTSLSSRWFWTSLVSRPSSYDAGNWLGDGTATPSEMDGTAGISSDSSGLNHWFIVVHG